MLNSPSLSLLRLSQSAIHPCSSACRRLPLCRSSHSSTNHPPPPSHTPSTLEAYVSQLTPDPIPLSQPAPLDPSSCPSDGPIHVPACPSWAMRPHPELYQPPVHKPTHRIHVATLVIEAYNPELDQLPLVAGFALQAAFQLGIPVSRPAAMPVRTELHTVLRSGFVHKKSQENFWRLTHRRVIKAYDANEEVVNRWINYLRSEAVRGTNVLLKAQRFLYRPIGWGAQLDQLASREAELERLEKPAVTKKKKTKKPIQPSIQLSPAEAVKELAERLIEEELKPRAEEHDALLAATGTEQGKPLAELKLTEDKK